jgi:hypothetical protein
MQIIGHLHEEITLMAKEVGTMGSISAIHFVITTKLITIERFFSTGFHEISAPKSHVLYQSYIKFL